MTDRKSSGVRSVRFPADLLSQMVDDAKRAGVSVNAWMADAARQRLDRQSGVPPTEGGGSDVSEPRLESAHMTGESSLGVVGTDADGLSPDQVAEVIQAEVEPDNTAMAAALQEAYRVAGKPMPTLERPEPPVDPQPGGYGGYGGPSGYGDPVQPQRPPEGREPGVREVPANPLPASVTDQWMLPPDDGPDLPPQGQSAPREGEPRAVYANDPLGMMAEPGEVIPEVDVGEDPHSTRPMGERWSPKESCPHRHKVTQQQARRIVCGDCNEVVSKW